MIGSPAKGPPHFKQSNSKPWPDIAAARSFLAFLAGYQSTTDIFANNLAGEPQVAKWLIEHGLGPLAYARCLESHPALASRLQHDIFSSVAENSLHWQNLTQIGAQFSEANIPFVLLKGAALAETVYGSREQRTMSDIDLWLRKYDIERARALIVDHGYQFLEKEDRPYELQMLSDGEMRFYHQHRPQSLVELHLSPFAGWWLKRTAAINNEGIWSRIEPLKGWHSGFQLSAEDTVIHIAVHMAVNHQCGMAAIRSLIDIALTAQNRTVDWNIVGERAKKWRVATAVWLVIFLLQQIIGTLGLDDLLQQLQPSYWRRKQLQKLVFPESVLLGTDISSGRIRFIYLLLLVDRLRDMGRIFIRTLWPEREWLLARYGRPYSRWRHLERIIRFGQP